MAVVTISRMFGAGGKTLGEMISQRLGYTFYNNELIQMVAQKAKVSTDWVVSMEKEAGGKLQKLLSGLVPKSLVDRVLDNQRGYLDEEVYVDMLYHIILKIADEGNAVILGRGSQYILDAHPDAYHVLLVADTAHRVMFIETHYDLVPKQAAKLVSIEDLRRVNLYRKFGKIDYDQPDHYHLVLNMSRIDLDTACQLICELTGACGVASP